MGCFRRIQFFLGIIVVYSILNAQDVASQPGFVSIDCGATAPYTDPNTGILWVPDSNYTSVGKNVANVPSSSEFVQQISTLRYFSELRSKYCYEFSGVTPNGTYMIRHSYWSGSYDGAPLPPSFYVGIDSTEIWQMNLTSRASPRVFENIFKAQSNEIFFCLYRDTTNANPFISSLELRPYSAGAYEQQYMLEGNFLTHYIRNNYGGTPGERIRYPDDVYDRIWSPWSEGGLITLSTPSPVDPNAYPLQPPSAVMKSAQTSGTLGPITYLGEALILPPGNGKISVLANLYFAELSQTSSMASREFTIDFSTLAPYPVNIYKAAGGSLKSITVSFDNWEVGPTSTLTLSPTPTSIDPPLLNAIEVYLKYPLRRLPTNPIDVAALKKIKTALKLTSWGGDPCLPLPINWVKCSAGDIPRITDIILSNYNLTGEIPAAFGSLTALTSLSLDRNALTGVIPDLSALKNLKYLNLGYNMLSGEIPASLGSLPLLTELYLQYNKFIGRLPEALKEKVKRNTLKMVVTGNFGITDPDADIGPLPPSASTNGGGGNTNVGLIAGVVSGVVLAIVVIACLLIVIWRIQKKKAYKKDPKVSGAKRRYSHAEVTTATQNYKVQIGAGGFGPVYRGKLSDGQEVAVKVSDGKAGQGADEFGNEVELLSRIHHLNLVSLVGYCEENNQQMLIYEFLPKGTVREHLYGSGAEDVKEPLDWRTRLDVALNAAQGLEYLHKGCNPNIIHRDIKSSNILLTDKYVAKVADFGLSKLAPQGGATHVVTRVAGTAGYLDPEYWSTNSLTEKSDVYSFGVVLLELLCSRKPIDNTLPDQMQNITVWARAALQEGSIDGILDPMIAKCYPDMNVVWKVAELAMTCVEPSGKFRPTMQDVVRELRDAISVENSSDASNSASRSSTYHHRSSNGIQSSNNYNSSAHSGISVPSAYDSDNIVMMPDPR